MHLEPSLLVGDAQPGRPRLPVQVLCRQALGEQQRAHRLDGVSVVRGVVEAAQQVLGLGGQRLAGAGVVGHVGADGRDAERGRAAADVVYGVDAQLPLEEAGFGGVGDPGLGLEPDEEGGYGEVVAVSRV